MFANGKSPLRLAAAMAGEIDENRAIGNSGRTAKPGIQSRKQRGSRPKLQNRSCFTIGERRRRMIWNCPGCKGNLRQTQATLQCSLCFAEFAIFDGIPDLRLPGIASWIDVEAERVYARRLLQELKDAPTEVWVRRIFSDQSPTDRARIDTRTRQTMVAPRRYGAELNRWLGAATSGAGVFLEVGCGAGTLLAAAASAGRHGIGVDASLVWLLVAARLMPEYGGTPLLAAAFADALPLRNDAVTGVVSLDVIEHVADPRAYLKEIDRVLAPGGSVALSTPNRFSLGAEPHVFVWGVGWLPRQWQKRYVRWRSGKDYEFVKLLGQRELRTLLRSATRIDAKIFAPPIPDEEVAAFSRRRAWLARVYNYVVSRRGWQGLTREFGPFFRIVGRKV